MKVFHIVTHFDLGGAERVALNIAHSKNRDFEYHIIEVCRGHSPYTKELLKEMDDAHILYHRSPIPIFISFHYLFERLSAILFPIWFVFIFVKHRPNIMHCHTEIPELSTFCFFKYFPFFLKRCKVVRTIHNTKLWNGMDWFGPKVERFLQGLHANVAISSAVMKNYQTNYGECPPIIYNGIVISEDKKQYDYLRKDQINILFAGRFEEQKGISQLLGIIRGLKDDNRYFFHVIGDGGLKEYLVDGLSGCRNVEIRPPLYGLSQYLSSFDYLLMPSVHEGLGLLSVEASMQCLPAIINNCRGLDETLPNDWPLKVDNNDVASYINIFQQILPAIDRQQLGERACLFVKQCFTMEMMQTKYEELYESKGSKGA